MGCSLRGGMPYGEAVHCDPKLRAPPSLPSKAMCQLAGLSTDLPATSDHGRSPYRRGVQIDLDPLLMLRMSPLQLYPPLGKGRYSSLGRR